MRAITRPKFAGLAALVLLCGVSLSGCSGGIPGSDAASSSTACKYSSDGSTPTLVTDLPNYIPTSPILKATCATHTAAGGGKPESYFVVWCNVAERGANIIGDLTAFDASVGTLVTASTAENDMMTPPCPAATGGSASLQVTLK